MNKNRMYKKKKWISLAVTLAMSLSTTSAIPAVELTSQSVAIAQAEATCPTYQEACDIIIALQEKYTEGMPWTNFTPYGRDGQLGSTYKWNGGKIKGAASGVGCAAFVFLISDAAFGNLPARAIDNGNFTYEDIKVGDILRINNNSHFVIVLKKSDSGVTVAEANYNKSVHWGRAISKAEVMSSNFIVTRYPENYIPTDDSSVNDIVQNGTEGNLKWTLTKGGTLTIFGNGAIPNYSKNDNVLPSWNTYSDLISTIVIENGVNSIGDYAFYESKAISVYIPNSVTSIGQSAFYGAGIISVTIPSSVENIGNDAFCNCINLTSTTVSEGVKSIGERAFRGCTNLQYIDFPSSITSVGAGAFMSCENMSRVRFMPGADVTIGDNLFSQCWRLVDVTLPQKSDCISAGMFQSCSSLPMLYIPATVTAIGENPFTSCNYLRTIYFGGSEAQWNNIATPYLKASLESTGTKVEYNAEFNNPFATEPDDPGDFSPEEEPVDPPIVHEHNWLTKWTYNATYHWHECAVKDCPVTDNINKNGYGEHSYGDWVIDTAATTLQDGSKHRECITCSYIQTISIPATGTTETKPSNPGSSTTSPGGITGDNSNNTVSPPNNPPSNNNNSSGTSSSNTGSTTTGSSNSSGSSSNNSSNNTIPTTSDSSNNKIDIADTSNDTVDNDNVSNNNTSSDNSSTNNDLSNNTSTVDTATKDVDKSTIKQQKKQLKNRFKKLLNKQLDKKLDKQLKKQLKKQQSKKNIKKQLKQELKMRLKKQLKAEFKEQLGNNFEKQLKKLFDDQFDKKFNKWFEKQYKKQNK